MNRVQSRAETIIPKTRRYQKVQRRLRYASNLLRQPQNIPAQKVFSTNSIGDNRSSSPNKDGLS